MARGKKTGGRDFKKGQGGRKRGAKDKFPRSFKASIAAVINEVAVEDPALIKSCIVRGLKAAAPKSFAYLQLAAAYVDGKPAETVNMNLDLSRLTTKQIEDLRTLVAAAQPA